MRNVALLAIGSMVVGIACASRVEPVEAPAPSTLQAAIASATLGDDCASSGSFPACAEARGGGCQQSNVQLSLTNAGAAAAKIAVVAVHLLDAATNTRLDDIDARNARIWNGSMYTAWDATLAARMTANVTYDMSQIDWTTIGGGNPWNTFSKRYKLEIVLRVDTSERTLVSGELSREPEVAT